MIIRPRSFLNRSYNFVFSINRRCIFCSVCPRRFIRSYNEILTSIAKLYSEKLTMPNNFISGEFPQRCNRRVISCEEFFVVNALLFTSDDIFEHLPKICYITNKDAFFSSCLSLAIGVKFSVYSLLNSFT